MRFRGRFYGSDRHFSGFRLLGFELFDHLCVFFFLPQGWQWESRNNRIIYRRTNDLFHDFPDILDLHLYIRIPQVICPNSFWCIAKSIFLKLTLVYCISLMLFILFWKSEITSLMKNTHSSFTDIYYGKF